MMRKVISRKGVPPRTGPDRRYTPLAPTLAHRASHSGARLRREHHRFLGGSRACAGNWRNCSHEGVGWLPGRWVDGAPSLPIYPLQLVTEEHRAFITYLPPAVPNALETTHYLYTYSVVNYLGYLIQT